MRVLLIAFYFPPAGGGGVQRALNFCRHLPAEGVHVEVLAPDDPKWLARDEALLEAIPAGTVVHRAPFHGPRAASLGEALRGVRGLRRLAVHARFAFGRALVPDKAVPWVPSASRAAIRLVRERGIDAVFTTSPPPSTHLTGAIVAARTGVPWVADFRDSWFANPMRRYERAGVRAKRALERRMARVALRRAAAVTAVTDAIGREIGDLVPGGAARVTTVANGANFEEMEALAYRPGERFVMVHAGSFFGERTPRPTLSALRDVLARRPELRGRVLLRFVGDLRPGDREWAGDLGIDGAWEETGFVPFSRAIAEQRGADALLLLIPRAGGRGESILSGKLFEYVAARRPILAVVPPAGAAAQLVREAGAGVVADGDDERAIAAAIEALADRWRDGGLPDVELGPALRDRVSRRARARELAAVLRAAAAAP